MKKARKGIIPLIAVIIIVIAASGGVVGTSVAVAHNKAITPDNALYGLRKAGQSIECAVSSDKSGCTAQIAKERLEDATAIETKNPTLAAEIKKEAEQIKNESQQMASSSIPNVPAFPD